MKRFLNIWQLLFLMLVILSVCGRSRRWTDPNRGNWWKSWDATILMCMRRLRAFGRCKLWGIGGGEILFFWMPCLEICQWQDESCLTIPDSITISHQFLQMRHWFESRTLYVFHPGYLTIPAILKNFDCTARGCHDDRDVGRAWHAPACLVCP